jgi:hypothetical protein
VSHLTRKAIKKKQLLNLTMNLSTDLQILLRGTRPPYMYQLPPSLDGGFFVVNLNPPSKDGGN